MQIKKESTGIKYKCPNCGTKYLVNLRYSGQRKTCKECGTELIVPKGPKTKGGFFK